MASSIRRTPTPSQSAVYWQKKTKIINIRSHSKIISKKALPRIPQNIISHLWHVKGHLHVTHSTKVVDFVGLDIGNDCDQVGGIAKIAIVKEKLDSGLVAVTVNVVDAPGIER